MAIYTFKPDADRVLQTGWVISPFSGSIFSKLDEGPGWDDEHIAHISNDGNSFEVAFEDTSTTVNALSNFGSVRCAGIRIVTRSSLLSAGARLEATLGTYASFGDGIPATPIDNTIIYVPGAVSVQDLLGPNFLEIIGAYRGEWSLRQASGAEWTAAAIDALVTRIKGWGSVRVYTVWLDVDLRLSCATMPGEPHYPNQPMGRFEPISWRYNNGGEGAQKKYHVKVFTAAQYSAGGSGVNTWTKAATLDSGQVRSSANRHDFTTRRGGKRIAALPAGTYTVAIRTAKDFQGQDWWSPDYVQTMVIGGYSTTITSPTEGSTLTSPRPSFTATTTVPATQGSEWRVYRMPTAGWGTFDPDTTTDDPYWYAMVDGTPATIAQPDLAGSIPNGTWRIYARFQNLIDNEWTDWTYKNFTMSATLAPAPQIATFTADQTNAKVDTNLEFYSGKLADEVQGVKLWRDTDEYDDEMVRISATTLATGLRPAGIRLPGENFSTIYTPNTSGLHASSPEIIVGMIQPNWASIATQTALASRWDTLGGNNRSWLFLLRTDRKLELQWSTAGTSGTALSAVSTTALPSFSASQEVYLRVTLSVTNPYTVTFYYSTNAGQSWTQLGTAIVGGAATSVFNTTTNQFVQLGASDQSLANLGVGVWTYFKYMATIGGTVLLESYFNGANAVVPVVGTTLGVIGANTSYYYKIATPDHEAPFNLPITYRAEYITLTGGTDYKWSAQSSATVTLVVQKVWLKVIGDSSLNAATMSSESWHTRKTYKGRSERRAQGRTLPTTFKSEGRGEKFDMRFTVLGRAAVNRIIAALESGKTLRLSTPKKSWYAEVNGDYSQDDHMFDERQGELDARMFTVPFIEVASPDVPSLP